MEYQQYVYPSDLEMLTFISYGVLISAVGFGLLLSITKFPPFGKELKFIFFSILVFGAIGGLMAGLPSKDSENMEIFKSNVAQKYDVQEVKFSAHENPKVKELKKPTTDDPQTVMLIVKGEERPATLTHNDETNEPTFSDVKTNEPLTGILKK